MKKPFGREVTGGSVATGLTQYFMDFWMSCIGCASRLPPNLSPNLEEHRLIPRALQWIASECSVLSPVSYYYIFRIIASTLMTPGSRPARSLEIW